MSYHPVVEKIKVLLDQASIAYKAFEHAPVRTSEEASALRPEYTLHQGAKALIVGARYQVLGTSGENKKVERKFAMLVVPGDCRFDEKKVKLALNAKDIRFATEQEVSEITGGVQVGGVPPFGNLFGLQVYVDPEVLANEEIIFNAGDRAFSIAMKSQDYKKIVDPKIAQII
ncbi:MAG TPA: YbaK/EbsC family protein [Candidatus Paceibacterota bacterium]